MSELKPETKMSLFNSLGKTIRDVEVVTDAVCKTLKILDECNVVEPFVVNYCQATLHLNLIYLDFCAAYRMHLGGETSYEKRFGIAQLYTILNEGYKRLYGFDDSSNITQVSKSRKQTVWYKYMLFYKDCDIEDVRVAYDNFYKYISSFSDSIVFDKDARSKVCHYPNEIKEKYVFVRDLNAENITQGAIQFMAFMEEWRNLLFVIERHMNKYLIGRCGTTAGRSL